MKPENFRIKLLLLLMTILTSSYMYINAEQPADSNECTIFSSDEKYGLRDNLGRTIIPPKYELIYEIYLNDQLSTVSAKNKRAVESCCRLFKVYDNEKYGILNLSGEEVLPIVYNSISGFRDGYALIEKDEKYGYIRLESHEDTSNSSVQNQNNNIKISVVIEPKYDDAALFSEGLAPVCIDGKCGYINTDGELKIPLKYESAGEHSDGLAAVKLDNRWGFIDTLGNMSIPCKFKIGSPKELFISPYDVYSLINGNLADAREVFDDGSYDFDIIGHFHDGMALVTKDLMYGYINKKGTLVIPTKYYYASYFINEKAYVSESFNGPGKFIDKMGHTISTSKPDRTKDVLMKEPVYKEKNDWIFIADDDDFVIDHVVNMTDSFDEYEDAVPVESDDFIK